MECTIALTAAKLAMYVSLTLMSADRVRIDCEFQDDSRLLEGISLMVAHAARNTGISEQGASEFATEAVAACRKAFAALGRSNKNSAVRLLVDQFQDRVEITLEYDGHGRTPERREGNSRYAGRQAAHGLQGQNSEGRSHIRLTKYCVAVDSKPAD